MEVKINNEKIRFISNLEAAVGLKSVFSEPQRISAEGKSHKCDILKKSLPTNSVIKTENINDGKKLLNSEPCTCIIRSK